MDKKVLGLVLVLIGIAACLTGAFFLLKPFDNKANPDTSNKQGASNMNADGKKRNEQTRPEYKDDIDISGYDTIFFGYPIWWGDMPMIVYSFIEKHDWNGKTVIPFNTHEGSGNSGTYETLKNKMSGAILKGDGFNMSGSTARTEDGIKKLDNWLESLGY